METETLGFAESDGTGVHTVVVVADDGVERIESRYFRVVDGKRRPHSTLVVRVTTTRGEALGRVVAFQKASMATAKDLGDMFMLADLHGVHVERL